MAPRIRSPALAGFNPAASENYRAGSIALVGSRMDPLPDHPVHALVVYRDEMGNTRHTVKMVSADGSQVCLRPLNFRLYREQRIPKDRVLSAFAAMRRIA